MNSKLPECFSTIKPKLPEIIEHYEIRNPVFHLPAIKHKFAENVLQYCLIKQINILNFNNLVVHRICLMMFKYSKDLVPLPIIVELFTRNYELHNHYTKQSQSLHTAVGRNEAIYKTFTFHGI